MEDTLSPIGLHRMRSSNKSIRFTRSASKSSFSALKKNNSMKSYRSFRQQSIIKEEFANIWIYNDDIRQWTLCKVLEQEDNILKVQNISTGDILSIDVAFREIFPTNDNIVADMASLKNLNEPCILHNISIRYSEMQTYTYMGLVLIAMNPFQYYKLPSPADFVDRPLNPETPHPFAIAELSFQKLCLKDSLDQSIVISGESGAGKTETAKLVLKYLVGREMFQASSAVKGESREDSPLEQKLLQSSPILEAFGNSKTLRNPNSSRFGKFLKIFFRETSISRNRKIEGATIETYLLEKSRVTGYIAGERNYHVFYYLLAGLEAKKRIGDFVEVSSTKPYKFSYLQANSSNKSGVNEEEEERWWGSNLTRFCSEFDQLEAALRTIGCSDESIFFIWRMVAFVLELGNVNFVEVESAEGKISEVADCLHIEKVANLCGIAPMQLTNILTKRVMNTRGEIFVIAFSVSESINARNAIAKHVYDTLFSYLVSEMNRTLCGDSDKKMSPSSDKFIGVLDIFGFESFQKNEFEQLLINFANEALQSTFNQQVFQSELNLYAEESITCNLSIDSCPNNSACVDLIASKSSASVLTILHSTCQQPKASDEIFCDNLHKQINGSATTKNKHFLTVHPKDKKRMFAIRHFAGEVKYTVGDKGHNTWVTKNNDDVPDEVNSFMFSSQHPFVKRVFEALVSSSNNSSTNKKSTSLRKPTISEVFSLAIGNLCKMLQNSSCAFIRCIKPNTQMQPLVVDALSTIEQIRALGLVQACEVMKVGLPTRISFVELKKSLGSVLPLLNDLFRDESEFVFIASLLWAFDVVENSYQLGITRVFFRSGQLDVVQKILTSAFDESHIKTRMEMALKSRKEAKELVNELYAKVESVEDTINKSKDNLNQLQVIIREANGHLDPLRINIISAKTKLFKLMESLSVCDNLVKDVECYGGDVSHLPQYDSDIKQLVDLAKKNLSELDEPWKLINSNCTEVEVFFASGKLQSLGDLSNDRSNDCNSLDSVMPEIRDMYKLALLESNRCSISKVEDCISECNRVIASVKFRTKTINASLNEGKRNASSVLNDTITNGKMALDIGHMVERELERTKDIIAVCDQARKDISALREKHLADEAQRIAQEDLARQREEAARAERERIALEQIALEDKLAAEAAIAAQAEVKKEQESDDDDDDDMEEEGVDPAFEQEISVVGLDRDYQLPSGWFCEFDEIKGKHVYTNQITNTRQWTRPEGPATSESMESVELADVNEIASRLEDSKIISVDEVGVSVEDEHGVISAKEVVTLSSVSIGKLSKMKSQKSLRKFKSDSKASNSMKEKEDSEHSSDSSDSDSTHSSDSDSTYTSDSDSSSDYTSSYESDDDDDVDEPKSIKGILMKQSGFFNMYKSKFFVLNDNVLECYKSPQDHITKWGDPAKSMVLKANSVISFTYISNTFALKTDDLTWNLMAANREDLAAWSSAIYKAISAQKISAQKQKR